MSSILDCLQFEFLDLILGTQVENNSVDNSELVLDLAAFHIYKIYFHGSLVLVCSGLIGWCWV